MRIGIIGAMEEEVSSLIADMEIKKKVTRAMMTFNHGTIYDKDVVIVRSGIGKVNAAVCTQILVDDWYSWWYWRRYISRRCGYCNRLSGA